MCSSDIFLGLLAILFPPLPVWVKRGICSADSIINILLCMLGFVPGLFHAWYIIAKYPEDEYEYQSLSQDAESGRVTYIIVQGPNGRQRVPAKNAARVVQGYGTVPQPSVHQGTDGSWGVGGQVGGVVVNGSDSANAAVDATGGEGSSGGAVPPTYAEAVKGDHKIQSQE